MRFGGPHFLIEENILSIKKFLNSFIRNKKREIINSTAFLIIYTVKL